MRFRALGLIAALAVGSLAVPLAAEAQDKGARVGTLSYGYRLEPSPLQGFTDHLRELGWVEGRNLILERRYAEQNLKRLFALAAELVQLKVDVILAATPLELRAVTQATSTIPIVVPLSSNLVQEGYARSLAQPGGNVTGLSNLAGDLFGKQLELLREAIPAITRVAFLRNPDNPTVGEVVTLKDAASALKMRIQPVEARSPTELDRVFAAITQDRAQAVLVARDTVFFQHRTRIVDLAARSRLPAIYGIREFVEAGGLMSYGVDLRDSFRRAAIYVDKILKGAKAGNLPIEQATKFDLVINMKTAKALGLTIPPTLRLRADRVIE